MKIYTRLVKDDRDMAWTSEFAKSFGHRINESLQTVRLQVENNVTVGYFQLIKTPIFLVGLHPELSKGRVAIESIKKMQSWSELTYGEALVGVNQKSHFNELLPRLDFKDIDLKLYRSKG